MAGINGSYEIKRNTEIQSFTTDLSKPLAWRIKHLGLMHHTAHSVIFKVSICVPHRIAS
jgi:hypothetical protein